MSQGEARMLQPWRNNLAIICWYPSGLALTGAALYVAAQSLNMMSGMM